jgi:hypothetical protein
MRHGLKLWIPVLLLAAGLTNAEEPVYAGYFRGPTITNSSGLVMSPGLYSFTDITAAADSAVRIGKQPYPANNWQKLAFDGKTYFTFFRAASGPARKGPGLYNAETLAPIGGSCPFTDWHGIGYRDPFYYGLYHGTGLSGPGLYRFDNPSDPESTAVRLFAPHEFPADIWSDVDFDGTRWLFVKTAAEGNPGIYQYDPETTGFICISGAEAYTNWDGLSVSYQ